MSQLLLLLGIGAIVAAIALFFTRRAVADGSGYNFTEEVRHVLAKAREQATSLRHEYIGTEHILLGVLDLNGGVSAGVLRRLSIEPSALRERILTIVKRGNGHPTGPEIPYTSRAKRVMEESMAEARELGHNYVGTEHLLMGLIREQGIASQVLQESGATVESMRRETRALIEPPSP